MLTKGDAVAVTGYHPISQTMNIGGRVLYLVDFQGGGHCYLEEGQLCKAPLERDGKDILREEQENDREANK